MKYQLVNYLNVPPGEYIYEQTQGIRRKFPSSPLVESLATTVADFRKANNLSGATFDQAYEDIVQYTCIRLGGNRKWCLPVGQVFPSGDIVLRKRKGGGCSGCGARLRQ